MLEVARARAGSAGLKLGSRRGAAVQGRLVRARRRCGSSSHLVDRPRAFAEAAARARARRAHRDRDLRPVLLRRVLAERALPVDARRSTASASRPPTSCEPSSPRPASRDVRLTRLSQTGSIDRDDALERIRGKHISTFDLLSDEEYEAGLARAERELPERVDYRARAGWSSAGRPVRRPVGASSTTRSATPLTRSQ